MAARTNIPVQTIPFQGGIGDVVYTAGDATNDMQFDNDGETLVLIKNGGGVTINPNFVSVADEFGRTGDETKAVLAGDDAIFGPFIQSIWNQAGRIMFLDLDTDASVSVAAIKFSPRK